MRRFTLCLLTCFVLLVPAARAASTATVILTPSGGGQALTFSFDPSLVVYSQNDVATYNATTDFGSGATSTEISFYNPTIYGGFNGGVQLDFEYFTPGGPPDYSAIPNDYLGAQMYSGPTTSPTLISGTYNVTARTGGAAATLQLELTPEPSSLLLLATGMGGSVLMLRRRFAR